MGSMTCWGHYEKVLHNLHIGNRGMGSSGRLASWRPTSAPQRLAAFFLAVCQWKLRSHLACWRLQTELPHDSMWPFWAATYKGVAPAQVFCSTKNRSIISMWPYAAATQRGVAPSWALLFLSGPCSINNRTISVWPCAVATQRGVSPTWLLFSFSASRVLLTSASCSTKKRTASTWPHGSTRSLHCMVYLCHHLLPIESTNTARCRIERHREARKSLFHWIYPKIEMKNSGPVALQAICAALEYHLCEKIPGVSRSLFSPSASGGKKCNNTSWTFCGVKHSSSPSM